MSNLNNLSFENAITELENIVKSLEKDGYVAILNEGEEVNENTEWQAVRKGSLQHEIFIGENPIVWNDDDLIIKVNCKEEANKIKTAIPYCLFVSFEVAEGFDVDLYADVSAKIRQRVQIPNN